MTQEKTDVRGLSDVKVDMEKLDAGAGQRRVPEETINDVQHKQRRENGFNAHLHKPKQQKDNQNNDVTYKKKQEAVLNDVKVEMARNKQRRNTYSPDSIPYDGNQRGVAKVSSKSNDYVYDNEAYVGSLNNLNEVRNYDPPTSVYREQYWACSKWSYAKKWLAIGGAVLLGGVLGLSITLGVLDRNPEEIITGLFTYSAPD